jgi:GT2 family glycosyltransferase
MSDLTAPEPVWIVVATWNNYADTSECLASLRHLNYPAIRVVIVDNGSVDGTPEHVRRDFPEALVLENGRNLGVPAGYNVGFRYALDRGARYLCMLNNDTVVDPAMFDHLVRADQPGAGILMPIVYYYDRRDVVWSAGARYRPFPPAIVMEYRVCRQPVGYHQLSYAIGCGMVITRRACEQVGLLNDQMFFNWEDLDLSERVRQAGLTILQVPDARLWHKVSRTSNPRSALFWYAHGESGVIYYRTHGRPFLVAAVWHLGWFALREFVLKWRWHFIPDFLRGVRSGLRRSLRPVAPFHHDG